MRVAGIDPSSSTTGFALIDGGSSAIIETDVWQPSRNRLSPPNKLNEYFVAAVAWLTHANPDMVGIESLSVERHAKTTRIISHYQAASVLAAKFRGLVVVEVRIGTARSVVLGNGGLSKPDAFTELRKLYRDHRFRAINRGGMDEGDATVIALATPTVAES